MITVRIVFYSKKTLFMEEDLKMDIPDEIVFAAVAEDDADNEFSVATAANKQIDYINCRPFEITETMKKYVIEHHPELAEKFDIYEYDFIGRHGLGPEYD